MVHYDIPLPRNRVYQKTRQADRNSSQLKEYLVLLGMRALAHGDMAHVGLITELIRGGGMSYE